MKFEQGAAVGFVGPVNRLEEAEAVGESADAREQVADHGTALAVGPEVEGGFPEIPGLGELDAGLVEGEGFAGIADEGGFVVEGVHVGRPAVHEEEDDPFGARGEGGQARRERMRRSGRGRTRGLRAGQEVGEGQGAETDGGPAQGLPTGERAGAGVHGRYTNSLEARRA